MQQNQQYMRRAFFGRLGLVVGTGIVVAVVWMAIAVSTTPTPGPKSPSGQGMGVNTADSTSEQQAVSAEQSPGASPQVGGGGLQSAAVATPEQLHQSEVAVPPGD